MEITCYDKYGRVIENIVQWDVGQSISIKGYDLTSYAPQIHFANANSEKALVVESVLSGGLLSCQVPNSLARENLPIIMYIYDAVGETGKTNTIIKIPVTPRPMPNDVVYTDDVGVISLTEVLRQAREYMNNSLNYSTKAKESEEKAKTSADAAKVSETNAAKSENVASSSATQAAQSAKEAKAYVGSPLVANTVSAMTDQTKIYVYTGSESGYTAGNWYYHNGSTWVSGGVYNSSAVNVDKTLTQDGYAADAKVTGDAVSSLKGDLEDIAKSITSKNLLNPNRVTIGKRMYVDGSVHELDSDFYTDFIPVKPNQHIYSSYLNDTGNFVRSQMRHVCAYDANKTVLPLKGQSNIGYDYLVPDGVAHIVVTFTENNDIDHRQLEVSDSGITSFEKWFAPYSEPIEKPQVEQNRRDILETKIKVNENSSRISFLNDNLNDNIMPISNTSKGMARKYNKGRFKLWKMPIEYDFVTPFNIFTDGNSFKTDFNAESYKNNYSNVKYLSPNGDDSGDGTIENPWKSFGKIREINGVTCYLKDGIYTVDNFSNWDGRLIGNFNLIGLGDVKIVNGDCPDNWELEDGLYKTVCKSDYRTCIDIETDVAGINYTKTDSLLECKATKCSYFKTNEFIYINTSLDTPNKKIALIYNNMEKCFLIYAYSYDTTPYIKNIKWYGSPNSETENSPSVEFVSYNDQVGKSKAVFDNCGFYCGYVGVQTNQSAETIFYNCEAANVYTDGFQYFGESKNIEINCKAYGCGLDHIQDNGQYDNGSTAHGKCNTVRINGSYYGNNGGNCADALDSNAFSLCLGCSAFDSAAEITSQGFALQGGQLSRMYLEACTAFGNKYDIQSGANGTIKIKKCESETTSENGGVIETIN